MKQVNCNRVLSSHNLLAAIHDGDGDGGDGGGGGGGGGSGGVQYALLMPEEPPDLSAWRQNE